MHAFDRRFLSALNGFCCLRHPTLVRQFVHYQKRFPAIALPRDYYDRMQWRKIFDRNPLFVTFSDKLATKDYIAGILPGLRLPTVLWQGTSLKDMPRELLAGNVVVKSNHGSGFNYFVRDGRYDEAMLARHARRWTTKGAYGRAIGEWAYGRIAPRIFIEKILGPASGELIEFNIRAGRGRLGYGNIMLFAKTPKQSAIYIDRARRIVGRTRGEGVDAAFLDRIEIPSAYDEALDCARLLSRDVDYARFDFFCVDETLYGGEITVYPASGFAPIPSFDGQAPDALSRSILDMWDMRTSWFMTAPLTGWRKLYRDVLLRQGF